MPFEYKYLDIFKTINEIYIHKPYPNSPTYYSGTRPLNQNQIEVY